MKCNRFRIRLLVGFFVALLGAICHASVFFGDDLDFLNCRVYTFLPGSTNVTYQQMVVNTPDEVFSVFASRPFCFSMLRKSNISAPVVPSSTNDFMRSSSFRYCLQDSSGRFLSPRSLSRVNNLYVFAFSLASQGYSGTALTLAHNTSSISYWNFDYKTAVSDILSSTNTVFRQILLSHLSQIESSVVNINSNVEALSPHVEQIREVNSSILSLLSEVHSNSVENSFSLSSNLVGLARFVNTNPFVFDFTNCVNALSEVRGDITQGHVDYLLDTYAYLDPFSRSVFALQVSDSFHDSNFIDSFKDKFRGEDFNATVVDALIGDYPVVTNNTRGAKSVDVRTSIKSQLQSWREEAKRQLQDWKSDLKQDLQDWKTSDERGVLNIRDDIRNNFSYRDSRPGSTNNLPFTSFVTNYVTQVITNVIRQSSNDIASNIVDQAVLTRKLFDDKLFDPNSDGVNVRIKWPLRYESTSEVNVHDQALDDILGNLHDYSTTMSNLVEGALLEFKNNLTSTNSVDWEPWFEKWGIYADIVTNFYAQFNSSSPVADLADRFLSQGFDSQAYGELPWFSRVEVLLAMIAGVSTNSVDVADISEELDGLVDEFEGLGTNVVSSSESFVGLFDYVRQTADRFKSVFGNHSAPVTDGGIVLLSAGSWIGNEPLVLKVNSTVQNVLRLFFRCFWLLSALVVVWLVVSWSWQKVVAVLRWLWSMFEL